MKFLIIFICFATSSYSGDFFSNISTTTNQIALTFDDAPSTVTPEICDVLKKYGVKATFFVLGNNVKKYPSNLKRIYDDGHLIGNHTYSHINLFKERKLPEHEKILLDEITKTENEIKNISGFTPTYIRFPYGYDKKWAIELAQKNGYKVFNWTFGYDWNKIDDEKLIKLYIDNIRPGAVFLMHDTPKHKKRILRLTEEIIKEAKNRNFTIVRLDEAVYK